MHLQIPKIVLLTYCLQTSLREYLHRVSRVFLPKLQAAQARPKGDIGSTDQWGPVFLRHQIVTTPLLLLLLHFAAISHLLLAFLFAICSFYEQATNHLRTTDRILNSAPPSGLRSFPLPLQTSDALHVSMMFCSYRCSSPDNT